NLLMAKMKTISEVEVVDLEPPTPTTSRFRTKPESTIQAPKMSMRRPTSSSSTPQMDNHKHNKCSRPSVASYGPRAAPNSLVFPLSAHTSRTRLVARRAKQLFGASASIQFTCFRAASLDYYFAWPPGCGSHARLIKRDNDGKAAAAAAATRRSHTILNIPPVIPTAREASWDTHKSFKNKPNHFSLRVSPLENQEAVSRLLLTFDPGSRTKQERQKICRNPRAAVIQQSQAFDSNIDVTSLFHISLIVTMAENDCMCLKILKNLRAMFDWDIENERREFSKEFYSLIENWEGPLPNLRDIFDENEIEYLLTECANSSDNVFEPDPLIEFLIKTSYKDEPKLDEAGKPVLRRTTPVHRAVGCGWKNYVTRLFHIYDRFDANYVDESGLTHFHVACEYGCVGIVNKFLEHGLDPNCRNASSKVDPPLHLALKNEHVKIFELLLEHGADPNLAGSRGSTALHIICAEKYDIFLMEKLFAIQKRKNQTVRIDAQDKCGNTPLHVIIKKGKKYREAVFLLKNGANPNVANADGSTALHVACKDKNDAHGSFRAIMKHSAERYRPLRVDAQDGNGDTPLHLALKNGLGEVAELLLRCGADPGLANKHGSTALHVVCQQEQVRSLLNMMFSCDQEPDHDDGLMELIFKISDDKRRPVRVNVQDEAGNAPLHLALEHGNLDKIVLLLKRGADRNLANGEGSTPLHVICKSEVVRDCEHEEAVKLATALFETKSDGNRKQQVIRVNARDNSGRTPLQWAVARIIPGVVDIVLNRGADVTGFAFPTEDFVTFYDLLVENYGTRFMPNASFYALRVIHQVEKRIRKLDQSVSLKIARKFAEHGLMDRKVDFAECLRRNEDFASIVKKQLAAAGLSRLPLPADKAEKVFALEDHDGFESMILGSIMNECITYLCQTALGAFLRRWALEFFLVLTRYRLPILCCEQIIGPLQAKDFTIKVKVQQTIRKNFSIWYVFILTLIVIPPICFK
ncbi:unnamed protein product, partial [Trichogramma brassicae]